MVIALTESMFNFGWAASMFGLEQMMNLLMMQPDKASKAVGAATQAFGAELGEMPLAGFLLADSMQREMAEAGFAMASPQAMNPDSDVMHMLLGQVVNTMRNLNPLQGGWLTVQELQQKIAVFFLVQRVESTLHLGEEPEPTLQEAVHRAYTNEDMDEYKSLWAVEGTGHWYGNTYWDEKKKKGTPSGILQGRNVAGIPDKSLTMLNAGIGMATAQNTLKTINHLSSQQDINKALETIIRLNKDNATPGYEGAAYESLGLVTTNAQFYGETRPDIMIQLVSQGLEDIDVDDTFEYYWRGVGRAHYFLPINMLPGYGSPWHAILQILMKTVKHATARKNAIAGLAWGLTMVTITNPEIAAHLVRYHGEALSEDNAYANGVASAMMMREDTTPNADFTRKYYAWAPPEADGEWAQDWTELVQTPCQKALEPGGYYEQLKALNQLGEIFRYHESFPELIARLRGDG